MTAQTHQLELTATELELDTQNAPPYTSLASEVSMPSCRQLCGAAGPVSSQPISPSTFRLFSHISSRKRCSMMFTARRFRQIALVLFAWIVGLLVCVRVTPGQGYDTRFQIGLSNTVTADPLVTRPHEEPCIVQLFSDFQFVNFNVQSYQFTPPAGCPGPWEKV